MEFVSSTSQLRANSIHPGKARVRPDGDIHVLGIFALVVAGRRVVAHGVFVKIRSGASHSHPGSTVNRSAADVCRRFPKHLRHVAPLVKSVHVGAPAKCAVDVGLRFVPELSDARCHVVSPTGDGEKILALTVNNVVDEVAVSCRSTGGGCAVATPFEWRCSVVCASAIVVPENSISEVCARRKARLLLARFMLDPVHGTWVRREVWRLRVDDGGFMADGRLDVRLFCVCGR